MAHRPIADRRLLDSAKRSLACEFPRIGQLAHEGAVGPQRLQRLQVDTGWASG